MKKTKNESLPWLCYPTVFVFVFHLQVTTLNFHKVDMKITHLGTSLRRFQPQHIATHVKSSVTILIL